MIFDSVFKNHFHVLSSWKKNFFWILYFLFLALSFSFHLNSNTTNFICLFLVPDFSDSFLLILFIIIPSYVTELSSFVFHSFFLFAFALHSVQISIYKSSECFLFFPLHYFFNSNFFLLINLQTSLFLSGWTGP